ncbi:hypothetical protein HF521_010864 [Silurus meridionalis]|uniref:Inversin n=1 Tax=Silurus meridionalis TaxID=175797 RepID=A0A8T0AJN1_SILME|nr:hypothetical protein HF521_010864 [Silurus meridionalis]
MATEQPLKSSGPSPLSSQVHAAAVNGDRSSLQRLITAEPCLRDSEDQFGRTPLMYCVLADRLDCAETLLKAGASVNKADRSKRTALHLAAQKGNVRFMKLLLSRHANWLLKDLEEMTPLHLATRHSSPKPLSLLLKHMAPGEVDTQDRNKDAAPTESLLNWQDYEGRTPLHFAVADGNEEVVEVLTSYKGCSVTAYDNLFRTPLHWASLLGHARIVHLLLERNKSDFFFNQDTVVVFLRHPSIRDEPDLEGRTAFMWAAGKGSDDVIKVMLELKHDMDINMADKYGGTALHAAALSGHISTVRLLLEKGAIVDPLDVMKHTPLFRACEMGHRDVILTLIKGGAHVNLVDTDGHSALHWAALGGNAEVCEVLMENGLGPNLQDHAGRTPLQCAAYAGYINCMALLIQHDADPNIQDKEGRTALHWSCNNGYLDAVKLLLGCGAFPNHMEHTEERYTPLDYALLGEHQEVTQFLLEHGALSIAAIQDIAASSIQALYKGYKVRRAFKERKNLLMRHEQLRKDAAKKREEERKREAEQQLLLAGAHRQMTLVQVRSEKLPLAVTELEMKSMKPKGQKHQKSSKVYLSQSRDRTEKQPKESEHRAETLETSPVSTLNLPVIPQTLSRSETRTDVCVSGVHAPEKSVARTERHSPAGSSRPGSARQTHPVHLRPRTSGHSSESSSKPESRTNHPAMASPPAGVCQSGRFSSLPVEAGREKSRMREPQAEGEKEKLSRPKREKERRTAKEAEKCSRTVREADKISERETQRGWCKDVDNGRRMEKEKEPRRKNLQRRTQAARVIQAAWRRFCIRRRLKELLCGNVEWPTPAEATALLIQFLWERPLHNDNTRQKTVSRVQSPPAKGPAKKSSVLQSIYGGAQAKRGRSLRALSALNTHSQSQLLHDLSLKPTKQMSGIECVHLLDSMNQAKQYSYHLRPPSASSQSRTKD